MSDPAAICLNCGCEPAPGSPLGLCAKCLTERLLDPLGQDDESSEDALVNPSSRYDLDGELARGGMGNILKAKDCTLGRAIAMKVMLPDAALSDDARQRFAREAMVLARLEHPNIVPIHELGRDEQGQLYYTMKLVQGETLQDILNRLAKADPQTLRDYNVERLLTIFVKVCDALAFAHDRGIIHRDLKPENVMVGRFGEVLVMDWGLAKFVGKKGAEEAEQALNGTKVLAPKPGRKVKGWSDPKFQQVSTDVTLDGAVVGTPRYMSPEQARGLVDQLDQRSDIFSLGAILYAILTLRPPVEGETLQEILTNLARGNIRPPSSLNDGARQLTEELKPSEKTPASLVGRMIMLRHCPGGKVPTALSAVAMRALARKPEDRYQSVGALTADIEAYQGGFATSAENLGLLGQLGLLVKRHRREFGIAFTAWFIITTLAVWFVIRVKISEQQASHSADIASQNAYQALKEAAHARKAEAAARAAEETAVREQQETRRALAKSRIGLASAAISETNAKLAREHLDQVPAEFRDASWHYLMRSLDSAHVRFPARTPNSVCVAVAARPGHPGVFALADYDGSITLGEGPTGRVAGRFRPPLRGNLCLAFSADGSRLAIGSETSQGILIVNPDTGAELQRLELPATGARRVEFAGDGRLLVSGLTQNRVDLWEPETGRLLWQVSGAQGGLATFHPAGRKVVVSNYGILVHDLDSGEWREWPVPNDFEQNAPVFDPSGRWLAVGDRSGHLRIWDFKTGEKLLERRPYLRHLASAVFTPDGQYLITLGNAGSSDYTEKRRILRVWHVKAGVQLRTLLGLSPDADALSLDPATGLIAVTGATGQVWRLDLRPELWVSQPSVLGMDALFLESDNDLLLPWKDALLTKIRLPDDSDVKELWTIRPQGLQRAAVNSDGRRVAIYSTQVQPSVRLFSALGKRRPDCTLPAPGGIQWVGLDAPGTRLLVVSRTNYSVTLHDAADGLPLVSLESGQMRRVMQAEFADAGRRVVGCGSQREFRSRANSEEVLLAWDATTGAILQTVTNGFAVNRLAVSKDGLRIAAACSDNMLRIYDALTLVVQHELRTHDAPLTVAAWHGAGHLVATAAEDLIIRLWDLEQQQLAGEIIGPPSAARSLNFSPSGTRLLGLFGDKTARLWDVGGLLADPKP